MSIINYRTKPHFIIKNNLQKSKQTGVYFSDAVTEKVLRDVCRRITGETDFTFDYVDNHYQDEFLGPTYNKGRIAILQHLDAVYYISFSEPIIAGRNSSIQSVPTAYNLFYSNPYPEKKLCYYFLNSSGNAETDYQLLIYRLMRTIGFKFLNADDALLKKIPPFHSIEDIIFNRRLNTGKNRSNNSTFITKGESGDVEVYGKTYGANKYETSLFCYALAALCQPGQKMKLYEVLEGDLKELPASSLDVIREMGVMEVIPSDLKLEKKIFKKYNSLRSPRYIYNLSGKLGNKHCALCDCEIPELIQGAHIWPVSEIKKTPTMTFDEKLECALDGENGLWLCENHHKMFDSGLFTFDEDGHVVFDSGIDKRHKNYINAITTKKELPEAFLTGRFIKYLRRRNKTV